MTPVDLIVAIALWCAQAKNQAEVQICRDSMMVCMTSRVNNSLVIKPDSMIDCAKKQKL